MRQQQQRQRSQVTISSTHTTSLGVPMSLLPAPPPQTLRSTSSSESTSTSNPSPTTLAIHQIHTPQPHLTPTLPHTPQPHLSRPSAPSSRSRASRPRPSWPTDSRSSSSSAFLSSPCASRALPKLPRALQGGAGRAEHMQQRRVQPLTMKSMCGCLLPVCMLP